MRSATRWPSNFRRSSSRDFKVPQTQLGDASVSGIDPLEQDLELVARTVRGDVQAFERIMRRYNQRLFRLAFGILGDAGEAEDVLQEGYVRAFYALDRYGARGSLGAWLAQIVRNEAIDQLRARKAMRKHITLEVDLSFDDDDESPIERQESPAEDIRFDPHAATENVEMKRTLEQAIATLPDAFRTVFMLREVEGLSIEETAEYLGIPAATVKTRDYRARNQLRDYLGERIDRTIPKTFQFLSARCDGLVARVLKRLTQ